MNNKHIKVKLRLRLRLGLRLRLRLRLKIVILDGPKSTIGGFDDGDINDDYYDNSSINITELFARGF